MRRLDIVMTVIKQGSGFMLQRREMKPSAGAGGLVGCFGGKIEPGERPAAAAARELAEETNLEIEPDKLSKLGEVDVVSDFQGQPIKVHSQVFILTVGAGVTIEAKEGELVIYSEEEARANLDEMTPATRATFKKYILKEAA